MKKLTTKLLIVITVIISFILSMPLSVGAEEEKTYKVAVYNNSVYAYQDSAGVWRGTDIECMINVSQRAGFKVEFIDSANDGEFMENLDRGVYDIVADIVQTDDRKGKYLFSDMVIGNTNNTLAVRKDDYRWDYGDIEQLSNMKIGVVASHANNKAFRSWCAERGVTPTIIEYDSIAIMTKALADGDIDGEVYGAIYSENFSSNIRTIMQLIPESFYFAYRLGDVELKNKIDTALNQIVSEDLYYFTNLYNRYDYQFGADIVPLSNAEMEYAKALGTIKIAVIKNDDPYYHRTNKGVVGGIIPDYYKLIADYCGLKTDYLEYDTEADVVNAVNSGEADVIGIFSAGIITASRDDLSLTTPFYDVNDIIITKTGINTDTIERVAVKIRSKDAIVGTKTGKELEDKMIGYENANDCFAALNSGEVDAVILGLPSGTWLVNQTNSSLYVISPLPGINVELCGAVKKDNIILNSILKKGIAATKENVYSIIINNTLPSSNWKTLISRIPPLLTICISSILVILLIALVWILALYIKRQKERNLIFEAQAETEKQKVKNEAMEKSTAEKNLFFSNISHDMRTPLNAITGFVRLAKKDGISEEERNNYLDKAETSSAILLDLINDTLTISKINSGKYEIVYEPRTTSSVFDAISDSIKEVADKKHIQFIINTEKAPLRTLMIDRLAMEKIFLNLLSNAIKFTPEGGHVWFTVNEENKINGVIYYEITIKDDGIGISKDFLPRIFDPFTQEKRKGYEGTGTGLGLSIVKRMVESMDGSISVQSVINEGTTFTLNLHFEEASAKPITSIETRQAQGFDFKGIKILLFEDNPLNQEIAKALLEDKKMIVTVVSNGRDGLELYKNYASNSFDLILMDVQMPYMDGIEATKAIRSLNRDDAKRIPIIAMTANAFESDIDECTKSGMNGSITKPINPDRLYEVMADVLSNNKQI